MTFVFTYSMSFRSSDQTVDLFPISDCIPVYPSISDYTMKKDSICNVLHHNPNGKLFQIGCPKPECKSRIILIPKWLTLEVLKSAADGVNTVMMFCDHTASFSLLMKCVTQPGHVYLPSD